MAIRRRQALGLAIAAAALVFAPLWRWAGRLLPVRCVEALRGRGYPGPRKKLEPAKVKRPGRWLG